MISAAGTRSALWSLAWLAHPLVGEQPGLAGLMTASLARIGARRPGAEILHRNAPSTILVTDARNWGLMSEPAGGPVAVTFAGSGDAFGSGGRFQACIHVCGRDHVPVLLDCGATSLSALKAAGLDPGEVSVVFISHLHGDHFGGVPFLILDGQFTRRTSPLTVAGPPGTGARLREVMEVLFPGSAGAARRFDVRVAELAPGGTETVAGIAVTSWEVDHPSGAPPLALRLEVSGKTIAYTGDTAWTGDLVAVASGADLLIAEAYSFDKPVPFHLRHADIAAHRGELTSRRIVLTHLSADMLAQDDHVDFETAYDGLVVLL